MTWYDWLGLVILGVLWVSCPLLIIFGWRW